jgi:tetratricopeptide (TPR) repeat protein
MPTRPPARRLRRLAQVSLLALLAGCSGSVEDRLAEARALQDAGHFSESVETLRALLEQEPELAEGWYLLGAALAQTGQPSLAVFPLEKAAASLEHRVGAGLLLATTFVQLEAYAEAIRAADAVLAVEPDRLTARRLRAHALLGASRREEAVVDARLLYEALPDDYDAGLLYGTILAELGRHEEAERVHAALEVSARDDPDATTRACLARASFFEDHLRDDERAEAHYRRCLSAAPADPLALRLASRFLDQRGRSAEALALWQRALEREPENLALRETLAARHELAGRPDAARALLREGVEAIGSEAAWLALVELERRHGETDAALRALAEAERLQARRDEQLLFLKGDLLVSAGRLDEAEALLAQFQDDSYRDLLRGAVLLARGDAEAAQGALDAGLRRWPDNAGARYLAGLAARERGDFERAVAELRESVRADADATDAALLLAGLESARGEHRAALDAARAFLDRRSGARAEGLRLAIRSQSALGLHDAARRSLEELRAAGFPIEAALAAADVESAAAGGGAAGAAAAVTALRACGLDPAAPGHEALLRALTERLLAAGQGDEALAVVDGALASDSERASLHELRGALLLRLGRPADAQAAFEAALARDAAQGRARAGLAALAYERGDVETARALYDEAARTLPDDPAPAYAAAQIALARGDRADARRRLEELVRRQPGHPAARNDLAWLLANEGEDLERALALAALAHRLDPSPEFADTLGFVHLQRGESERAAALFEEALAARPESQSLRFHLGLALARAGERERAVAALRAALAPGPFPEAEAARDELARLERP